MKTQTIRPYSFRMPPDLKKQLQVIAKESGRSLNQEMIHRLKESVKNEQGKL